MATKYLSVGVDGTGSKEWMRPDGANSHVYRFIQNFRSDDYIYADGPSTFGFDLGGIIDNVVDKIQEKAGRLARDMGNNDELRLVLVGHSRGAAAVISIANRLNSLTLSVFRSLLKPRLVVQYMGLYDTVLRAPLVSIDTDMPHVTRICHAIRKNDDWNGGSRGSFGSVHVPGALRRKFDTAHGGVGGDPGFFDPLSPTKDLYCNAWTVCYAMTELIRRRVPVRTIINNTPADRAQRIAELKIRWQEAYQADEFIRLGAAAACGPDRVRACSAWKPYAVGHSAGAARLARLFGIATLDEGGPSSGRVLHRL
jgi:hypothetical protein